MSFIGVLPLLACLIGRALAQDGSTEHLLDPSLSLQAQRSNEVTYDVDFSVVVTPPNATKKLQVWLPIPTSDFGQSFSASRLSSFPIAVEPKVSREEQYGNWFAYFEFDSPRGAQIIRHNFGSRSGSFAGISIPPKCQLTRTGRPILRNIAAAIPKRSWSMNDSTSS